MQNLPPSFSHPLILLAAGRSSRMGSPKGLLSIEGAPWIVHQLRRFREIGGRHVFVVLGHWEAEYRRAIEMEGAQSGDLEIEFVKNPAPDRGAFSSVQLGIEAVLRHALTFSGPVPALNRESALALLPLDVPVPHASVWTKLSVAFKAEAVSAVLPELNQKGGHPVLLSREFARRLLDYPLEREDARLDHQLRALSPVEILRIPVKDPEVLLNLNQPAQWREYLRSLGRRL